MLMIVGLVYLLLLYGGTAAGCLAAALCLAGLIPRNSRVPAAIGLAGGVCGACAVVALAAAGFLLFSSTPPPAGESIWLLWASCGFAAGAISAGLVAGAAKVLVGLGRRSADRRFK
jgi:hypothetical protein